MNLHYELQKSNSSSLAECIQVYDRVFCSTWCEDLISYFETSIHYRTDDHRKQSDQLQLIGDPRPDAIDYKNELGGSYLTVVNPNATASCGCGESFAV